MAYRRSICTRATLLARRFNPSFTYISHDHNNDKKRTEEPGCRKIDDLLSQRRFYGTCMSNVSRPGNLFDEKRLVLGGVGSGVGFHRYMSTSMGEGADKVDYFGDVAEVIKDTPVEAITSQLPVVSEVATAAADSAYPVAALQYVIEAVHSVSGLNWALSIALTTLLIRGATVPFLINQLKSTSKLSIMRPHLEAIKEEMTAKGNDPQAMEEGRQKMNAIFKEYGVTPFTPLKGLLIQGPVFISFFFAISNMAEKVPSFKNGGAFWFTDLTTPDSMYIFPVLTALTFLINVEFNMQEGMEGNPIAGTMKKFSRVVALLTVPFTLSFPKAIFFYWITSNIFSCAYGSVLKMPGVKKALGIPDVPVPPPTTNTRQGKQPSFASFFKALKQASQNAAAIPAAAGQSKPATHEKPTLPSSSSSSSSAVLSQRLKSLERQVKQRKKNNKR